MATTAEHVERWPTDGFRHEALLYAGDDGFLEATLPWIRDAVAGGEPILVVISAARIARLREELGADAEGVTFADMADVGTNPARIIPAWREFVDAHAGQGRRLRASASRSGPAAAPRRSLSASATRRCSTSPSRVPRTSGCSAPTTSTPSAPTSSTRPIAAIRPWWRVTRPAAATPTRTSAPWRRRLLSLCPSRRRTPTCSPSRPARWPSCAGSSCCAPGKPTCPRWGPPTSCSPSTRWRPTPSATAAGRACYAPG